MCLWSSVNSTSEGTLYNSNMVPSVSNGSIVLQSKTTVDIRFQVFSIIYDTIISHTPIFQKKNTEFGATTSSPLSIIIHKYQF